MFKTKKELKQLEEVRKQLENEKQELLFIKEQLGNSTPKVDTSNIYIWEDNGLYSIVKLNVTKYRGYNWGGLGKEVDGYHSTLTNIFTNEVIFEKNSMNKIESEELIRKDSLENSYFAHFFPIYAADRSILAYADKKVPMYVLQQLYYKLNNVNVNAQVLKKTK